jgi:hypothetical protein
MRSRSLTFGPTFRDACGWLVAPSLLGPQLAAGFGAAIDEGRCANAVPERKTSASPHEAIKLIFVSTPFNLLLLDSLMSTQLNSSPVRFAPAQTTAHFVAERPF